MKVLFDITRLIFRSHMSTPTGIDRVDLAYAYYLRSLFPHSIEYVSIFPALGLRVVPQNKANKLVDELYERWNSTSSGSQWAQIENQTEIDVNLEEYIDLISNIKPHDYIGSYLSKANSIWNFIKFSSLQRPSVSQDDDECDDAFYIHTSHICLEYSSCFEWIRKKGIKQVFFIHDLIPITHPQYCSANADRRHRLRMANVCEFGFKVIVNSNTTLEDFQYFCEQNQLEMPDNLIAPLGVEMAEKRNEDNIQDLNFDRPFFLFISTIEARKNHEFIFKVWRKLVKQNQEKTPLLLVVGNRGWMVEEAISILENCKVTEKNIIELGTIAESHLEELMKNASALVMPSHVEGFSYPVAEAMNNNLTSIISDIPAHRELAAISKCKNAIFCSPDDASEWEQSIMKVSQSKRTSAKLKNEKNHFPWDAHFNKVIGFLKP